MSATTSSATPSLPGTVDARPRARRRRLWRRFALAALVATVVLAVDAGLALWHLRTAQSLAVDAQHAAAGGRFDDALDAGQRASDAAGSAHRRTSQPHWSLATRLPLAGPSVEVIREASTLGAALGDLAQPAMEITEPLLAGDTGTLIDDGRIDLEQLDGLVTALGALPTDPVVVAGSSLRATSTDAWIPDALDDARDRLLRATDSILDGIEDAHDAGDLASALLGADGPRHYLLAVQNPAELRGTGGLVGFLAVLRTDDGAITLDDPSGVDAGSVIDGTVLLTTSRFSREERFELTGSPEYEARYARVGGASFLPSTNIDPDLPTVAPLILEQYAAASGERLDGLIALDPLGLQLIQQAIGPLDVPADVAAFSTALPDPIPADELAQVLLVDSYETLGGGSAERRRYQAEVAGAALSGALAGGWQPALLANGFAQAVTARHLQLYSSDPGEQASIERLGAAGALAPAEPTDDLLAITVVNIAGNKADLHVAHRLHHEVQLAFDQTTGALTRHSTSRLEVDNLVDPDSDRYITSSLLPRHVDEERVHDERHALVNSWVTVWSPAATRMVGATDLDGDVVHVATGSMHTFRTIDRLLETVNGTTSGVEVGLVVPTDIRADGDQVDYALTLWRQAKGISDELDLHLTAPAGWTITDARLTGGGEPLHLGPAQDVPELELRLPDEATVRVEGAMRADVRLQVTLQRG